MTDLRVFFRRFRRDRRAVTALEYGLIAAVVVVVGLAGFSVIGGNLANKFSSVNNSLTTDDGSGASGGSGSGTQAQSGTGTGS